MNKNNQKNVKNNFNQIEMKKTRGNPKSQTYCSLFPSIKRTTEKVYNNIFK